MRQDKRNVLVTGIYTLTQTHCGTGQAAGAVDLPIAREAHTELPVLPATTLKGVARDLFPLPADRAKWTEDQKSLYGKVVKPLFGPLPPTRRAPGDAKGAAGLVKTSENGGDDLSAGNLVFLDGWLLALAVRSLTGVFRQVTSPMLLRRLKRTVAAFGGSLDDRLRAPELGDGDLLFPSGHEGPVSLEDLVFEASRCREDPAVSDLAEAMGPLVSTDPNDEDRLALSERLVVVSDDVLRDLALRSTPVAARIVLDADTKTSRNLWYEEALAPDCLFASVLCARPGAEGDPIGTFLNELPRLAERGERIAQIGGNATVGFGQCRWVLHPDAQLDGVRA